MKNIIIGASYSKENHCGYCDQNKSTSYGLLCQNMEPMVYQKLMLAGFRRSGQYFYRYDVPRNCCPVFSIFLEAKDFKISKSQRRVAKRCQKRFTQAELITKEPKKACQDKKDKMSLQKGLPLQLKILQEKAVILHRYFDQQLCQKAYRAVESAFGIKVQSEKLEMRSKVLACKNKKDEFSSNYWLMFFGVIKQKDKKLQLKSIINAIRPVVNQTSHQVLKYRLEENGYLSLSASQLRRESARVQKAARKEEEEEERGEKELELEFKQEQIRLGNLRIKIERAKFQEQSFLLYRKFSDIVHQKKDQTKASYEKFLCLNNLGLQHSLGSFHFKYVLSDRLIAVGVCDITASMLSSVYFFYDPDLKDLSLGVFSQLVQISYVKNRNAKEPQFKYYTMGFYIQGNQKMSYKGDLIGSKLLCPITFNLVQLTPEVRKLIDQMLKKRIWPQLSKEQVREAFALKEKMQRQKIVRQSKLKIQQMRLRFRDIKEEFRQQIYQYLQNCLKGVGKQIFSLLSFKLA